MVVFRKAFAHRLVAESSCRELVNSLVTLEVLTSILLISSDEVKIHMVHRESIVIVLISVTREVIDFLLIYQ